MATSLIVRVLAFTWFVVGSCDHTLKSFQLTFPIQEHAAYAQLQNTIASPLQEFTLCQWVRLRNISLVAPMFSYATAEDDNELNSYVNISGAYYGHRGMVQYSHIDITIPFHQWTHLCTTWSVYKNEFKMFHNGRELPTIVGGGVQTRPVAPGGIIIIGQEQDAIGGGFVPAESLSGDISEIHLWDYILCSEQISRLGHCEEEHLEGNVISWRQSTFTFHGPVTMSPVDLCSEKCSGLMRDANKSEEALGRTRKQTKGDQPL